MMPSKIPLKQKLYVQDAACSYYPLQQTTQDKQANILRLYGLIDWRREVFLCCWVFCFCFVLAFGLIVVSYSRVVFSLPLTPQGVRKETY